ncbi:hypothetical protein [Nitrosopumilus sp. Nsub]|uniref:hypothetical protein n=1 Tax=Nitrosopumilus sp. Nsub TaxID=1776294 RepID=UPI0020A57502|nr:hypothetical protein [Nitrosopumilus sp. Nsub]
MLKWELIDLMKFCLQNPDSSEIPEKHTRINEIGQEIFNDGDDAIENFSFVLKIELFKKLKKIHRHCFRYGKA